MLFSASLVRAFWFLVDRGAATDTLGYPIAVAGIAAFAWRASPGALLLMVGAIAAGWTLGQGYMSVHPMFPGGQDTPAVRVEGFLAQHQQLVMSLWQVNDGQISALGQESSRRYFLKGASGVRHSELMTARFDQGDARLVAAAALEGNDFRNAKHYLRKLYSSATFAEAPRHARALSSTCWFGATRIAWVVGDRPAEVSASMNVEQFALANAGHHVLMTVEMTKRSP